MSFSRPGDGTRRPGRRRCGRRVRSRGSSRSRWCCRRGDWNGLGDGEGVASRRLDRWSKCEVSAKAWCVAVPFDRPGERDGLATSVTMCAGNRVNGAIRCWFRGSERSRGSSPVPLGNSIDALPASVHWIQLSVPACGQEAGLSTVVTSWGHVTVKSSDRAMHATTSRPSVAVSQSSLSPTAVADLPHSWQIQ